MKSKLIAYLPVLIVITCLSIMPLHSNAAQWASTYGGTDNDELGGIQQTADGGYIVGGTACSLGAGGCDFWIGKLDTRGNITWQKTYGGSSGEIMQSIQKTADGGYIAAGYTWSFGAGESDCWILKLDANGSICWQKTYGGDDYDKAYAVQQTNDGGYIIAGSTESFSGTVGGDFWIVKLDTHGNVIWQKAYRGSSGSDDRATHIRQTSDGGYIVAGWTSPYLVPNRDIWILKLDAGGTVTWQKTYDINSDDLLYSIQQTADGGYITGGFTLSGGDPANADIFILKLDENGNITWQKTYGGTSRDVASSIRQNLDGGYIVAGGTESFGAGSEDVWILKLDSNGDILGADFINTTHASVTDTSISGQDTNAAVEATSAIITETMIVPRNTQAHTEVQAFTTDWQPMASPTSEDLNGVWGITETRFYAVGNSGTVLDYDGINWAEQYLGTNTDFNGIWGSSTSDVFVVGDNGTIYHYTTTWSTQTSGTTNNLNGIWGSSSSNVFAVGDGGTVLKYNGSAWSKSTPTTENLNGIWGYDSSNIYAVGDSGTIIKYNGSTWNTVSNPATENLNGIWGFAGDDIYAVGDTGTVLHYNGTSWTLVDAPTVSNLNGIWGSKPSNLFVVGDEGTILYYGGTHWIEMDSGIMDDLRCPFGIANPHVFVVGFAGYIGLLQGPYLYGTICDSCTGNPLTGIQVTWDNGPPTGGSFTTTKEVYDKFGIGGGYHILSFAKTSYQTAGDTLVLPPNKIDVDHRTYLMPTTYSQYNGCVSGVVAKDILIDGSYPDGVVTKGVKEPRINVKLYKPGGCGDVEVENVYTNQNGHFHFPTITKPGIYTLRMLNPDPQHCEVKTYNPATHQLQAQDSFSFVVPQLTPARYDFKLECEEGLVE